MIQVSASSVDIFCVDIRRKVCILQCIKCKGKGKGKSVPLQAWSGPEGSVKLRLPARLECMYLSNTTI